VKNNITFIQWFKSSGIYISIISLIVLIYMGIFLRFGFYMVYEFQYKKYVQEEIKGMINKECLTNDHKY